IGAALEGDEVDQPEEAAAEEAAQRAAQGAVTDLAQRAGGDPLAEADGHAEEEEAQAAGQHGAEELDGRAADGADAADEGVVDALGDEHAQGDAVAGQADEAEPGPVADGLDADDEVADAGADEGAVLEELAGQRALGGDLVAEDAEEHPAEQAAQRAEDRVEVDARQHG